MARDDKTHNLYDLLLQTHFVLDTENIKEVSRIKESVHLWTHKYDRGI